MKISKYFIVVIFAIFSSCEDLPLEGALGIGIESIDSRFEYSLSKDFTYQFKTLHTNNDEYTVYVAADFHVEDDIPSINQSVFLQASMDDEEAVCCLTLGDIGNGSATAYQNYLGVLMNFPDVKVAGCLGNHDLHRGGWQRYKDYFGCSVYYFEIITPNHKDLYICLDSANGTLGRKQTAWLKDLLNKIRKDYRHCIVFTHSNLTSKDISQGTAGIVLIEELYALFHLFSSNNVSMVLSGHDHYYEDAIVQGVKYVTLDSAEDDDTNSSYLKVRCADKVLYDIIRFR